MDQTEVRDAALEVLSHLEEIAGKGRRNLLVPASRL